MLAVRIRTRAYVEALRPRQWVKSTFVLTPLVFSGSFRNIRATGVALVVTICFCLAASAVYLFNDVCDIERDRRHPVKCRRPIARGDVLPRNAMALSAVMFVGAVGPVAALSLRTAIIVGAYIAMNLLYSRALKGEPFVDVMVIATGFVLRVVAGGSAVDVDVSPWMLLTTFFLALFLGFGKRREESIALPGESSQRGVMSHYSVGLLNGLILVSAALTITTYSLYALTSRTVVSRGIDGFVWTVPPVVFGVFRYLGLIFNDNGGADPAEVLLGDKVLIADVVAWAGLVVFLLLGVNSCALA